MTDYLEVVDPRGYKVICSKDYWNNHVLLHHPDMAGKEKLVIKAIEKPFFAIYRDAHFEDRQVYYYRLLSPTYMKVVVKFDDKNLGLLISAFTTDSAKPGEKPIWPE